MKNISFLIIILLTQYIDVAWGQNYADLNYSVATEPWEEAYGNHRAVVEVGQATEAVILDLEWRRYDKDPGDKRFIIVNSETGEEVENIHRIKVDNETCELAFGPVKNAGIYYFYYLPYEIQEEYGFYNKDYLPVESKPDSDWLKESGLVNGVQASLAKAKPLEFQSRTAFDSFFPMEVIALQSEKEKLQSEYKADFLIFPEDRKLPIRMLDEIPYRWIQQGPSGAFEGEASKNEYYTFQLGVFASQKDLRDLKLTFSALEGPAGKVSAESITCFNTGGMGPYGEPFVKVLDVEKGDVQPLWIGIDLPENIAAGNYRGKVTLSATNSSSQSVDIRLRINNKILADRGDGEPWRHSRLRWLNSTLGIDNEPTEPFQAISEENSVYSLTQKHLQFSDQGLPSSVLIKNKEMLNRPISFKVQNQNGTEEFAAKNAEEFIVKDDGLISSSWKGISDNFSYEGLKTVESDGYIKYVISLKALKPVQVKDISLEIPFKREVAKYMMGMGLPGTDVPEEHHASWKGPHDSFWMGSTEAGLWCELRGREYHGPLLNLYHPEYPDSWYNDGKGGFTIKSNQEEVTAIVSSGERSLAVGEELDFEWAFILTPIKELDSQSQFNDRYYHNGAKPEPSKEDFEAGVKVINVHHANQYNPHINYPFVAVDAMKGFIEAMHEVGEKVKIYYTIRELTNYTTEIWALRSLGNEILGDGNGGGYPWLREHLVDGYRPQWYQYFPDKSADASIVNAPGDSRWYNYYIEGLAWLVENVDIDGLYLDDVSYDRRTLKRIRKVLDRTKPGCLLDLHSNTGFSKGPATQYMEFFPYLDKLWFGESFHYDEMSPTNWLVEVSGIPYGLMGDMLHAGGNPWRGMVYGMTVRYPWYTEGVSCDPRAIWKLWDDFGISEAKMIGYWDEGAVVKTSHQDVLATAYVKEGELLIAVASWAEDPVNVKLDIDWKTLGIGSRGKRLKMPGIEMFQEGKELNLEESFLITPKKGFLIIVE
ncbi:glycoside hydrolase domain-containing protein [Echinicola shivajiensis]|uniref:glycoside hydrolase domain-containing protein n=1 Tax=Echinicola shivajiensis TaxID=1035916 RepID=UPI001BFC5748|nr:glycoside hydrolase domain-containing protein [Echinicola shivajiensis]